MSLPQARIVKGGQHYAPPPAPVARSEWKAQLRDAAAMAIGMWPLVAVMLFMVVMLFATAHWSAP